MGLQISVQWSLFRSKIFGFCIRQTGRSFKLCASNRPKIEHTEIKILNLLPQYFPLCSHPHFFRFRNETEITRIDTNSFSVSIGHQINDRAHAKASVQMHFQVHFTCNILWISTYSHMQAKILLDIRIANAPNSDSINDGADDGKLSVGTSAHLNHETKKKTQCQRKQWTESLGI